MENIHNETSTNKVIISEKCNNFEINKQQLGHKYYTYRMTRIDGQSFKVTIPGIGVVINVSTISYTDTTHAALNFWYNGVCIFRTEDICNKVIEINADDNNDIIIGIKGIRGRKKKEA